MSEFCGVFPLLAEDEDEPSAESLAIRWLQLLCHALDVLHRNGLTHGDVSPRNMIVSGGGLVLTDYDFVCKIGESPSSPGTMSYCSPSHEQRLGASPADDLYALAGSFFHILFDKEPFRYGGRLSKERGLNWEGIAREGFPLVAEVFDKATHCDPQQRFATTADMFKALKCLPGTIQEDEVGSLSSEGIATAGGQKEDQSSTSREAIELSEQRVDWLKSVLQAYPGSQWGNRETRGLDSTFAADTYVETPLEQSLLDDIRNRRVRLVVLCGNAGDGKTALLQHLAQQLGLGRHTSSERVLEGRVSNGPRVRMNLDGGASWKGRSADEILDEFLAPFHNGPPSEDIVHLLAVNDGRLLEWIERIGERLGVDETPLTVELYELLQQETPPRESHIRFISLNERSLVGGILPDRSGISTVFLERLVDHLYGGERAGEIWSPCRSCSAKDRCRVFQAGIVFGPDAFPARARSEVRTRGRQRLFEAFQAVHSRGETHITVRELRLP